MHKRIGYILVCVCLLFNLFAGLAVQAEETVSTGTVHVTDTLRVRSTPDTSQQNVVGYLYNNDIVTIHETVLDKNGGKWYRITKDSLTGYASADYITINASYESNQDFEAYLTAQGFPESYKDSLRQLHALYPNWVFEARHLTMTWNTAFAAESKVGLNTIQSPDAWKSMEYGAYNWTTGSYVAYDSGGWVSASPSLIAYYMDPRNFLNTSGIFQFEKLTYAAGHTAAGVRAILPDVLDKHAEVILEAAKATNVSAYFLAARITQEGTHINGLGTGTVPGYEGYYNFFDIGAYAANGNSAVVNGAIYAKNKGWDTPLKCITDSANIIANGYIRLGQDTNYFQKFNVTNAQSGLYAHQYMTNTAAAANEGEIRRRAAAPDELKTALVFSIPVYKNMPDTVAPLPSKTGNNNNFLSALTVEGGGLTPSFDRYTMAYAMQANADATTVTVRVKLSDKNATLTGTGDIAVQKGENLLKLAVKSSSGAVRTYTIAFTAAQACTVKITTDGDNTSGSTTPSGGSTSGTTGTTTTTPPPTITGNLYTIGSAITKVEPDTTVSDFIKNLAVTNGVAYTYAADGQEKTSGIIGTGDILRIFQGGAHYAGYPIVIYGDVNGDGKISSLDLRIAQKHILGIAAINGYYLTASDSSKDGALTSLDLRITQKYILGITKTLQ